MIADRQFKILHLLSAVHGSQGQSANSGLRAHLLPLLSKMDQSHFKMHVINFAAGDQHGALLRKSGVPVFDIELSRRRFALGAVSELRQRVASFKPDLIHAWGHSAQLATRILRGAGQTTPMIWSMPATSPSAHTEQQHWLDRYKLKLLTRQAHRPAHLVYGSTAGAAQYARLGFPESAGCVINIGADADRFKPDARQGQRLRAQLKLDASAYVIGMYAPFTDKSDYVTFIRATAELIKYQPEIHVIVAGRGVQRGNSGIMAMLGGGTLATRTSLLGDWSDLGALFNACDVVCSSALDDSGAAMLASAMLCGIPCVGTGRGLQGEVLFNHGITVESGSVTGLARGITRIMEMPADKRAYLTESARQHIINHHSTQSAVQKYLSLYLQMMHGQEAATAEQALKLARATSQ